MYRGFLTHYEYNLYSIASLIVSANRLAMCTCIIIAVLIYHDVIIQILPRISMWLDTHIGLNRPHFFKYIIFNVMSSARYNVYENHNHVFYVHAHSL